MKSYDAISQDWDECRFCIWEKDQPYFDLLVESLAPSSRVLDFGCGTGRPNAQRLCELGHSVVGIDQSQEMLKLAKNYAPSAVFICADIANVALDAPFDGAICWDALFHVERSKHESILRRIFDALRPSARLIFTAGGSANPAFEDQMFGKTFFYDSYPPEETTRIVELIGFDILKAELVDIPDGGRNKGRLAVVAEKAT